MKIGELRDIIKSHKKKELEFLVAELYKLIPKDKKEDYNIDEWIHNPVKNDKKTPKRKAKTRNIEEIANEVTIFTTNAYAQNYLCPNQNIPKKERPKWRFIVKRLYKEINVALDNSNNPNACIKELIELYKLLTYSANWTIFTAYDAFDSVEISQIDFFNRITNLQRTYHDIRVFIPETIKLIINNPLNRYTLHTELIYCFFEFSNTPDMLKLCFEFAEKIKKEVLEKPDKESHESYASTVNNQKISYEKKQKLNSLAEIGFLANILLNEYDKAIKYFYDNYIASRQEIRLYVLIQFLFNYNLKDHIIREIDNNQEYKPREQLQNLYNYIKTNNQLPESFYI